MKTMAPEHGFWNGQTPVSAVFGDDLVSVRFLERFRDDPPLCCGALGVRREQRDDYCIAWA